VARLHRAFDKRRQWKDRETIVLFVVHGEDNKKRITRVSLGELREQVLINGAGGKGRRAGSVHSVARTQKPKEEKMKNRSFCRFVPRIGSCRYKVVPSPACTFSSDRSLARLALVHQSFPPLFRYRRIGRAIRYQRGIISSFFIAGLSGLRRYRYFVINDRFKRELINMSMLIDGTKHP